MKKEKQKQEFSKTLLIQESILIWVITLFCLFLAVICVFKDYTGSLPWFASMVGLPWAAYGVSQACYYNKAKAENTKDGIKYDATMTELAATLGSPFEESGQEDLFGEMAADVDIDYGL